MAGKSRLLLWGRRVIEDPLVRESALLTLGTALGQLAPLLALPFLGRMYTGEDFGIYALFLSAVNILSQLACLKYDMAIPLAGEEEGGSLFWLSTLTSLALGGGVLLLLPLFLPLARQMGAGQVLWALLIPPGTALVGINAALIGCNLKRGQYKTISRATVIKSLTMVAAQFLLWPLGLGGGALVLGQLAAYLLGNLGLWRGALPLLKKGTSPGSLRRVAGEYRRFPLYTMAGSLCGSMVYNLTNYLLALFYSTVELGYYSMVGRIVFTPLTLLSGSVGQVFLKHAADARRAGGDVTVFTRATGYLALLSLPLFGGLFLLAEPLMGLLGPQWAPAAGYLRLLIPLAAARFVVTPISATPIVFGQNRLSMVWQVGLLGLSLLPAGLAWGFGIPIHWYLGILSPALSLGYLWLYRLSANLIKTSGNTQREEGHL